MRWEDADFRADVEAGDRMKAEQSHDWTEYARILDPEAPAPEPLEGADGKRITVVGPDGKKHTGVGEYAGKVVGSGEPASYEFVIHLDKETPA